MFISRWEQRLYEIRFVWIQKDVGEKRGTIRTHWNADCLLEDFSGKNHKNIVNWKLKHLDDVVFRELVLESECSFTKYVSSCPNTKYLYLRLPFFENEGVLDDTDESVFQFLVRYDCIKNGKIKRFDACYMVESWRFKMF